MPVIPVGSGLGAQLLAAAETTYGVTASLASPHSYEFKNETLELKKTTVQGEGLAAGHVYERTKRRVLTMYDVNGAVTMDCPTRQLGFWCQYMVGDFTETPAQIGSTGIYQTVFRPISSQKGQSFSLQKGIPTADSTLVVEPVTEVGCKLASWALKVATGGIAELTLNLTARNELAGTGNGDPLNASVPALALWGLPTTGLGESVFHFRQATLFYGGTPTTNALTSPVAPTLSTATTGGTVLAGTYTVVITYVSAFGETLASVSAQQVTTGSTSTLTVNSPATQTGATGWYAYVSQVGGTILTRQQAGAATAIGTNLTLTAPPTTTGVNPPLNNTSGIVSLTSPTTAAQVKDATIGQSFSYDDTRIFLGSTGFKSEPIENNYRKITGSFTAEWQSSEAFYNAFSADTTTSLELKFVGASVSTSNYLLDIVIPNIKLEGETPKVGGPAVVTQALNFIGLDDEATYPIQITYQSEDVAI